MRAIDLKSVLVAGAIGAVALIAWYYISAPPGAETGSPPMGVAIQGFAVGAIVQVGVRLTGVS